jgi:uncharacterized protein YndB with AHSA1/START domain
MEVAVQQDDVTGAGSPDGHVERSIDLPAEVDEVWGALTDPERIGTWFGAAVDWDLRPGGEGLVGPGDDGAPSRRGEVDEVVAGRRLRFRWWPEPSGDDDGSAVTYELTPLDGGTRLVVTEVPLVAPPAGARARAQALSASTGPTWALRLVGLWLGCHTRLLVQV